MKSIWLTLLIFCLSASISEACQLFRDIVQDVKGNVLVSASVSIYVSGTSSLATIYSDAGCTTTASNPITTGSDGTFSFYIGGALIDIQSSKSGYTIPTISAVPVFENMGQYSKFIGTYTSTDLTAAGTGALDQIGSTQTQLIIDVPATATLDDTCPSTLTLIFTGQGTLTLSSGKTLTMNCRVINLTGHSVLLGSGTYTASSTSYLQKSYWFGVNNLTADATQCAVATAATLNSGPKIHTMICTDNDASSIYGQRRMPDNWDGGTITFTQVVVQTASDTSALNGDITAQCRGAAEVVSSTWGTEVAMDKSAMTGGSGVDQITSAAVTPAGTCAAGDQLFFRWQLDATGTTTAVATLHVLGFMMNYLVNPNTPLSD